MSDIHAHTDRPDNRQQFVDIMRNCFTSTERLILESAARQIERDREQAQFMATLEDIRREMEGI